MNDSTRTAARERARHGDGRFGVQPRTEAPVDLGAAFADMGAAAREVKAASAGFQVSLKREVAAVSGVEFEQLRRMRHDEWSKIRRRYCGNNNQLLPRYAAQFAQQSDGR